LTEELLCESVSIPHRYGKNVEKLTEELLCESVSIPHRYGKNLK